MMKTSKKFSFLIIILILSLINGSFVFSNTVISSSPSDKYNEYEEYLMWKQNLLNEENIQQVRINSFGYDNFTVHNQYIEFAVATNETTNAGRYSLATTGGDPKNPNDNYKNLLFGHPNPMSSFTTIQLNGRNYVYKPNTQPPTIDNTSLSNTSECTIRNVSVKQVISIVKNPNSLKDDTIEVKYIVKNNDVVNQSVGLRIMMDTMLGDNDTAPFRLHGVGSISKELELSGGDIPEFWQAFDNLANPSVIAHGTLLRSPINPPTRVQFANWYNLYTNNWNYIINPNDTITDSAIGIYWDSNVISPGETKEYVTYYGLSEMNIDPRPPLALGVTAATNIEVTDKGYNPNPFTVTAYVQNTGNISAHNLVLNLILPKDLKLVTGQQQEVTLDTIKPLQDEQTSWQVEIEPSLVDRNLTYQVIATADNTETKVINMSLFIPAYGLLSVPSNISTIATSNSITVNWDAVDGAATYDIEIDGEIVESVSLPYIHKNLNPSTLHSYRVRAKNDTGITSDWSTMVSTWTLLETPMNLLASSIDDSIELSWDEVAFANEYVIEVNGVVIATTKEASYIYSGLTAGSLYTFRVMAKNDEVTSAYSLPLNQWTIPLPPTNLTGTASDTTIKLSWEVSYGATSYDVMVGDTIFYDVTNPYDVINLNPLTVYTCKVRAKNQGGISHWSEEISVGTFLGIPQLTIRPEDNRIRVSWGAIEGATSYELEVDGVILDRGTNLNYVHNKLTPGLEHTYRIRAISPDGYSPWSELFTVYTLLETPRLSFDDKKVENEVHLTWDAVAGASSYEILVNGELLTEYFITEEDVSPFIYKHIGVTTDEYVYEIRAKNDLTVSDWGKTIKIKIK